MREKNANTMYYTNQKKVNVGTGSDVDNDPRYDVSSLVAAWRSAPYLHDGRAAQVIDVFTLHNPTGRHGNVSGLSQGQLNDRTFAKSPVVYSFQCSVFRGRRLLH
jgi:hypothetical protein